MFKSWKSRAAVFGVAAVVVGVPILGVGGPAGAAGAGKFDLQGPNGSAFCDGSGVDAGAPGGFGFAVINAPSNGTVSATVSVKGLKPNTSYTVRLIQGVADCFTVDGTIVTNGVGNGTINVSEPSVSTHAFVAVDAAGAEYVTNTYNH